MMLDEPIHWHDSADKERLLDYVLGHDGVWVCRREEIARHWTAHHPFTPRT
jgi:hypothetical protein